MEELKSFVLSKKIDMLIVGPEGPLVDGIRDKFEADNEISHIPLIGPDARGALLEGSKEFAKDFMKKYNIPTAEYRSFSIETFEEAKNFLKTMNPPYVLKADGLAAGKGVLILDDYDEAVNELNLMFEGKFGQAGSKVVIEEHLSGIELSVFVLTDGKSYKLLPEAKDYKRIGEGDTGLNTGGMGAISPVPFAGRDFLDKVEDRIIKPTLSGLAQEGIDYRGFIFIGLMNCSGDPKVIESNVRMGDPEAEVVIPRIKSDLMDLMMGVAEQNLDTRELIIDDNTVITVMLVSGGYPGDYEKGKIISGADKTEGSILFHAGTENVSGRLLTSGGRVIAISSLADGMDKALETSFRNAEIINFEGKYYRKDIGFDLK
jgi:phosphoribosylamine--glycine ligase